MSTEGTEGVYDYRSNSEGDQAIRFYICCGRADELSWLPRTWT